MKDLRPYIEAYISNWNYINNYEDYKWHAIKHFQDTFFARGVPFGTRIKQSFLKHVNLLDTQKYFPLGMLYEVYADKPNITEAMVNALFDESKPLRDRVNTYMGDFDAVVKQMAEEGHSNWYGRKNLQSYQDVHAISVYLSMRYPSRYYIYKYGIFRDFSNIVGYKIQHGDKVDRYIEFNQLCDEVKKSLLAEVPFISFYDNWLKAHEFDDGSYNLLTQDFIYAVATYLNHGTYTKADKKKNIEIDTIQIEAHEFPSIDVKISKKFKGIKDIDYAEKDRLFRGLGLLGEQWAIIYEQERLKALEITFEVRHSSVCDGDGIGYDILSVEDDGVTPRYIEVKTTTGGVKQPFYYSDNELQFSEQQREHYYVYRVFNFKSATKQADVLIIHGSLKDLNGKPISYMVSVKGLKNYS